jgi:hypothetical protein
MVAVIVMPVTHLVLPLADTRAHGSRARMRARADAMTVQGAACANGPDMRAGFHAAITDTGAGGHDRAGMAARGNAMAIHARARADTADMGARAHAMLADMRVHSDTQHLHIRAGGIRCDGREKREYE